MKVFLIPCIQTEWQQQGRLLGRVELEPTDDDARLADAWTAQLRDAGLARVFHSPDQLATRTAKLIAGALDISVKSDSGLSEVDLGLWAGLTESDLKSRYAKAHRQLLDAPLTVQPPGGEEVSLAADRLRESLRKRLKKNGKGAVGLVLRPLSFALVRCLVGETDTTALWSARLADGPVAVDRADALSAVTEDD